MLRPRVRWVFTAFALGALALSSEPQPSPAQDLAPETAERELVALTNLNRTSNNLPSVIPNPAIVAIARSRSLDMATRGYFSHEIPPDGKTFLDLLDSIGIQYELAGENLEFNTASEYETVQYANRDFLNSPTHRRVALNPRYREVGAGVAHQGPRRYYTVIFLDPAGPESGTPVDPRAAESRSSSDTTAAHRPETLAPPVAGEPGAGGRLLRRIPDSQPGLIETIVHAVLRQQLGL